MAQRRGTLFVGRWKDGVRRLSAWAQIPSPRQRVRQVRQNVQMPKKLMGPSSTLARTKCLRAGECAIGALAERGVECISLNEGAHGANLAHLAHSEAGDGTVRSSRVSPGIEAGGREAHDQKVFCRHIAEEAVRSLVS